MTAAQVAGLHSLMPIEQKEVITLTAHAEALRDLTHPSVTRGVLEYVAAVLRMLTIDPYEAGRLALGMCRECESRVCRCQFEIDPITSDRACVLPDCWEPSGIEMTCVRHRGEAP